MKILVYLCIILAAIALIIGAISSFLGKPLIIKAGLTYWRGGVALLLFGIYLMLLQYTGFLKK